VIISSGSVCSSSRAALACGLPQSVDGTFTRLVDSLHIAWSAWNTETGRG